jgi:hypothetical protein
MERDFLIQVSGWWMNGWIQPSLLPNVEDDEGFLLETASSSSSRQRIPDVTMNGVVGYDYEREPKIASVCLGEDEGCRQMDDNEAKYERTPKSILHFSLQTSWVKWGGVGWIHI